MVEFVSPSSPHHAYDGSDPDSYSSPLRADFAPISRKKKKGSVAPENSIEKEFSTEDDEGSRQVVGCTTSQVIPSSQMSRQSSGSRPDFGVYEAEAYSDDNGSTVPSYSNKSERSGGKHLDFHSDTASDFGTEGWTDERLQLGSPKSSDSSTVDQMFRRISPARNTLDDHTATQSPASRSYSGKPFWTWRVLNPRLPLCSLQNLDALVSINQKKGKRVKGKASKGKTTKKNAGRKQTRETPVIRRGRRRILVG
jgi:hypothetical protein